MFDSQTITAGFHTLHRQAVEAVSDSYDAAYRHLESLHGKAYADTNPEIIAAMIAAYHKNLGDSVLAVMAQRQAAAIECLSESVRQLAEAL